MKGNIERVVAALNAAEVRYLIVGGVAVVLHGSLRTTRDLDLVLHLEPANLSRALAALEKMGFESAIPVPMQAFFDPDQRRRWIEEKKLVVFSLWHPAMPGFQLDLFASEPFDFEATYSRAARVRLDTTEAMVVSLSDLTAMKRRVARPQDLADVAALERIERTHEDHG